MVAKHDASGIDKSLGARLDDDTRTHFLALKIFPASWTPQLQAMSIMVVSMAGLDWFCQ